MRKIIVSLLALCGGIYISSATVTVQGWWHLDSTQPINDSSGNSRSFGSAYSTDPATGGQFAALPTSNGAGGPLGTNLPSYTSTQCIQVGVGATGKRQSAMWGIGYNPPAGTYGIEVWVMPQDNGIAGGSGGWLFSSGESGGVALRINAPGGGSYIDAFILGSGITIGDQVPIDTNRWMHLAIVDNAGTLTFYTNGIACGASVTSGATTPAGAVYIGTPSDNQAYYGYMDEARMFTFSSGAFSTNDLLLRPAGPIIISQSPANVYVWNGGAAPFSVNASFDTSLQYQWRRGGSPQGGATKSTYFLPTVAPGDTGSTFDCILTSGGISVTSSVSTLQVVSINSANVAAYQNSVQTNSALVAYFPVDGDTGTTLHNTKDGTHNGLLELGTTYDGRTNTAFGQRALSFNADGDVQIPNNSAFEFSSGFGTIEALVYMSQAMSSDPTIFAEDYNDGINFYYAFRATANGGSLVYNNYTDPQMSWAVPGGLIGRISHVAFVFDKLTNVTAYANGQNLGTKTQTSFSFSAGGSSYIGGMGNTINANRWPGTIDELAIYGSALSENTIQGHYSTFVYGTNTAAPSFVSRPTSRTVFAGASPVLVVQAAGTLPLSYAWTSNSVPVAGATTSSLAVSNLTTTSTYGLTVQNSYGSSNITVVLTVAAPPAGYTATVMTDHPTALWRMNDSSGQPALDSAGFNDGVYNGSGVTYGAGSIPGEAGTAATFDGLAGRAIVPYTTALNPNHPFTVDFWAKLNAYAFYVPVCSMDRPSRSGGYEFYLDGNGPGYEWHSAAGGGYNMLTIDFNAPTVGGWYHVAGVYDGTNLRLHINGNPADGYNIDSPYMEEGAPLFAPNLAKGFYIGSRSSDSQYFNGTIADVAFYNYALTQQQLRKHVFAGLATPIQLGLTTAQNVALDSKPVGAPHAGINNGATWVASSSDGSKTRTGVIQFNGANQITLAPNPDFDSLAGTIMFWMKSAGTVGAETGGAMLLDRRIDPSQGAGWGSAGDVIVQQDDGSLTVQPTYYGSSVLASGLSGGAVSDNTWHHVAYVYDQTTTGGITLYVDGVQVGTDTYKTSWAWAWVAAQQIELGKSHDAYWKLYNGQIDDFRIYNRMLGSTEISSVYSTDALVDTTALKVRLNFDSAPGQALGVSWTPSVAMPQSAGAVKGPYVDQPTGRTPLLVPSTGTGFFRGTSQ